MVTVKENRIEIQISQVAVSRLLNGDLTLSVKEETRRRIIEVSEWLGYTPARHISAAPSDRIDNATRQEELADACFVALLLFSWWVRR